METRPRSRITRLAVSVYEAQGGKDRSLIMDGPWWYGITTTAAVCVLRWMDSPWKWLALAVIAVLGWVPAAVRFALFLARTGRAFVEGYRS